MICDPRNKQAGEHMIHNIDRLILSLPVFSKISVSELLLACPICPVTMLAVLQDT